MPDGKTHSLTTVITTGIVAPLQVIVMGASFMDATFVAAGCLLGLVMGPDLDVRTGSHSFSIVRKSGGSFLGWFWRVFWYPYARLIPRHRHPLSHWPILGTALRLVYLMVVLGVVYYLARQVSILFTPYSLPILDWPIYWPYFWQVAGGLALVDTLHTLMDWIF